MIPITHAGVVEKVKDFVTEKLREMCQQNFSKMTLVQK
jgi:hypothetical protein